MLLASAVILAFHRGKPVRLRVTSALLLPVLAGAVFHLFLCKQEYVWSFAMFGQLWTDGLAAASGGVLAAYWRRRFNLRSVKWARSWCCWYWPWLRRCAPVRSPLPDIIDFFREK